MSECKTVRYIAARDAMIRNLAQYCDACDECGDCVDAKEPVALLRCRKILREIERMTDNPRRMMDYAKCEQG